MAPYFYDLNLNQNDDPNQPKISGASPTTDVNGGGNSPQGANKSNPTGSGFQNLDSYLKTNDAKGFGQQVLGKVQGSVDTAKQNQNQAFDQFKSQVSEQNKTPTSEQINAAVANPSSSNAQQYQGWLNQSFQGPHSLPENEQAWNQYWSGTNKAANEAKLLNSEPGRFTLLESYFGRPNYSYGQKALDNALLQNAGISKESRNVKNQAVQLQAQGAEQANKLQDFASQKAGEIEASKKAARQAIGLDENGQVIRGAGAGALGKEYQSVEDALASANQGGTADYQALSAALKSNSLSPDQLKEAEALGLKPGTQLYGFDPSQDLVAGAPLVKDQVMTPEQRARIQALSGLAGIQDTFANGQPAEVSPTYTFDLAKFANDLAGAKAQYFDTAAKNLAAVTGAPSGTPQFGDPYQWYQIARGAAQTPERVKALDEAWAKLDAAFNHPLGQAAAPSALPNVAARTLRGTGARA